MKNKEIEELLNTMKDKECYYVGTNGCLYQDLTKEEINLILSYIEQLQTTVNNCKQKLEQYENPDDLTLFYMWLDTKAKDKIKQLEKRNKQLYEGFMATQEELTDYATENEQLKKQKDDVVEYIKTHTENIDRGRYYEDYVETYDLLRMLGEIDNE